MTPLDYYLWGAVKDKCYANKPETIDTLMDNIREAIGAIVFGKCFKKKLLNIFFQLIMENNFIQMAASAGHAVANTIGSIFKHIINCVQLYFTYGFTNIVL